MPVPKNLMDSSHCVFYYTADLKKAATTLAKCLKCPCVQVVLKKGYVETTSGGVETAAEVAWLVGHGLSGDKRIGSQARGVYVEVEVILDWLVGAGYSSVVDTCCQPDKRREEAAEYPLDFYCTEDGRDVFQIWQFKTVDKWWDACSMRLRSTGPEE